MPPTPHATFNKIIKVSTMHPQHHQYPCHRAIAGLYLLLIRSQTCGIHLLVLTTTNRIQLTNSICFFRSHNVSYRSILNSLRAHINWVVPRYLLLDHISCEMSHSYVRLSGWWLKILRELDCLLFLFTYQHQTSKYAAVFSPRGSCIGWDLKR